jgi:hypothetical protein
MESIQSFLARLPNTFNEQRPTVKVLIGCSSIYIICLCLSISVAIVLPSKPTPVLSPTPATIQPTDAFIEPSLLEETSPFKPIPTQTLSSIVARPDGTLAPVQISLTIIPNSVPDMIIRIGHIYEIP